MILQEMISKHILGTFDEALGTLRRNVLMMSSLTTRSLDNSLNGLFQRDDDACATAIADDEEIDQLEKQVDKDGIDLLLRFQPVASDLRRVVSAMKLCSNLERMGDQAVNIARKARKLNQHPVLPEVGLIEPMRVHAMKMFQDSVEAYVNENVALARGLKMRDKTLDEMNANVSRQLTECMAQDPDQLRGYLNLMFIARHSGAGGGSCDKYRRGRSFRRGSGGYPASGG